MHSGANFSVPLALEPSIIRGGFFLFSRGLCPQTPGVSFMVVSLAVGHRFSLALLNPRLIIIFYLAKNEKKNFKKIKKKFQKNNFFISRKQKFLL